MPLFWHHFNINAMACQCLQLVIFLRQHRLLMSVMYTKTLKRLPDSINASHRHNISHRICMLNVRRPPEQPETPPYIKFNQSLIMRMAALCLLARCGGFMLIMEIGVKSAEQCEALWSFLSMSLLHYYWHAASFHVLKCLHLSGIGKCQMHGYLLVGHAWDHNR